MVRQSEKIGTFGHGYTYSGHPVIGGGGPGDPEDLSRSGILSAMSAGWPRTCRTACADSADHPLVGEVRGIGLIAGVELVANKATKAPFDPKLGIGGVARFAQEHGLIVRAMGDSFGFSPPLIITSAELDDLAARFGKALDDTVSFVTNKGLAAVA